MTVRFLKFQKKFSSFDINYLNSFFVLCQIPEIGIGSHKQNCYLFLRLFHLTHFTTGLDVPTCNCLCWAVTPTEVGILQPLPSWQYPTPHGKSQVFRPLSAPTVCLPIDLTLPVGYKKKYPSGEVTAAGACGSIHSQEAESSVHWLCSQHPPFMQPRIPARKWSHPWGQVCPAELL